METTGGVKLFADVVLKTGTIYVWTGINWSKEARGQTAEEVTALIKARVPRQFRDDADTSGQYFQKACWWKGTQAQFTALTTKITNCEYNVE